MVGFPLLLIPLAVYNIIVFLMPGVSFTDTLFKVPMLSEAEWQVTLSDVLLALGIVLLLLEVIKGARPGAKYFMDHLLSLVVFGAAAAEFVLWPKFANSTFFLLTLLAMVDFFAGVAQRTRRRAVAVEAAPASRRSKPQAEVASTAPQFEPAARPEPVPQPTVTAARDVPSAHSVAESVLKDRPEPGLAQPAPDSPAEEVSPRLQPNNTTPSSPDTPSR
jgi:hypothetical protein